MNFTKAIVLSETDLSCFMADFLDAFFNEYILDRDTESDDVYQAIEDAVSTTLEEIFNENNADLAIVFIGDETYQVYDGRDLLRVYGVDTVYSAIDEFMSRDEDEEGDLN